MRKLYFLIVAILITLSSYSQKEIYGSSDMEMIFSFSKITQNGNDVNSGMRYTWWYNVHKLINYDVNNNFGVYLGLGLKNIGFGTGADTVYFHGDKKYYSRQSEVARLDKVKQRTYSLGVPLGFKFGNFDKGYYFFLGGEYEYAFHYKEKVWVNNEKRKYSEWFGTEITTFLPSVFAGFKFKGGTALKFTWYLDNFVNQGHNAQLFIDDNTPPQALKPYRNTEVQVFYVSISFLIDKKTIEKIKEENPKMDM